VKNVIFACLHSAGRSQMAAAWFNHFANPELAKATSAGTRPAERVHPIVVDAMKEVGLDLSQARPQLLTGTLVAEASVLITMGCGEQCPVAPHWVERLDWELQDPKDQSIERVRQIRDDIKSRVLGLVQAHQWAPPAQGRRES
jgi:arsenate reductase (thioredoxin)